MSLTDQIAGMPLAALLDYRPHYERALRWETSPIRQAICTHTLQLINQALTRRMPPEPGGPAYPLP